VHKQPAEGELEAIPAPVGTQKKTTPGSGELPYVEEQEPPKVEEQGSGSGYRVQIFASSSLEKAEDVAKHARTVFSEPVYVEYSAPLYRVRVGDFSSKEEALVLKAEAVDAGYEGAWITEASIQGR
jgi:cell division septation protein DedD